MYICSESTIKYGVITNETSGVKLRHKVMTVNTGDPDTVTVHSRKNGANGNLTCSQSV
jgi:hypothetical protein